MDPPGCRELGREGTRCREVGPIGTDRHRRALIELTGHHRAMSERPADVIIGDFRDPEFSPEIAEIHASVGPMADELVWEPAALMDQACAETGLDDFGAQGFTEPLALLVAEFSDPATGLSPMGLVSQHTLLVTLLKNRLRVQDELHRHPGINDRRIDRPIIIAGLPRTGTTHLHNLLAADPALRSLAVLGEPRAGAAGRTSGRRGRGRPSPGAIAAPRALDVRQRPRCRTSSACTR